MFYRTFSVVSERPGVTLAYHYLTLGVAQVGLSFLVGQGKSQGEGADSPEEHGEYDADFGRSG